MLSRLRSQVSELWGRLTLPYRILTVGLIVGGLISVALVTINANSREPNLVVLASDLDPKEAVLVRERLTEAGINHSQGGDGFTFLVKPDDLFSARLALAEAGLPRGGNSGYELLDSTKLGVTEAERRVNFKRAMEGELARAIGRMQSVQSAVVFLNLPEESLFIQERQPGSASVLLELQPGQELKPSQVTAITKFVASSVPGLGAEEVQLVDTNGRTLVADGGGGSEGNLLTGEQLSMKLQIQQDLEKRLQTFLETAYGPGNVEVRVTADLDFDAQQTSETRVEVPAGSPDGQGLIISSETDREEQSGTTSPSGGVAGTDPNAPPMYNSQGGGGESESSRRHEIVNREVDRTQTTTIKAVGQVRNLSVGVVVNAASLAEGVTPAAVEQEIGRLVTSVVAADIKVTDALGNPQEPRVQVSALPFNRDAAQAIADAIRGRDQEESPARALGAATWLSAAAGLLAILFALLALWRRRQQSEAAALALAGAPGGLLDLSSADFDQEQDQQPLGERLQREFTIEELLDPEFLAKMADNPERQAVREHIEKVVRQDPSFVAQLLRAWINDD